MKKHSILTVIISVIAMGLIGFLLTSGFRLQNGKVIK